MGTAYVLGLPECKRGRGAEGEGRGGEGRGSSVLPRLFSIHGPNLGQCLSRMLSQLVLIIPMNKINEMQNNEHKSIVADILSD